MIPLVDNHDSYTFNLAHLIAEVAGEEPVVVPADRAISHVDDVAIEVLFGPEHGKEHHLLFSFSAES